MNQTMELLLNRKSVRAYEAREISEEVKGQILSAALRAPTAGNMTLYSIIEVKDQGIKDRLVKTCDNQPFIARAPLVLLFLADYQRWMDYFLASGVGQVCEEEGRAVRQPEEGDLFLACCDALIAAQTAVVAAESLGVGSCYIGDIMENYEEHRAMFDLPGLAFPICLICFGYPTQQQKDRALTPRFDEQYVIFEDRYRHLGQDDLLEMFRERQEQRFGERKEVKGAQNFGQAMYNRKFDSEFSREMSRSVRAMIQAWVQD